jgi:hypothetical protein
MLPVSFLTLAKLGADDVYGPIYWCSYSRPGRTGFIAVSSLGLLVDMNERLTIRNLPFQIRQPSGVKQREVPSGSLR